MTKKALSDFGSMLSVGQFVLKIGFVTSKKKGRGGGGGGEGGGVTAQGAVHMAAALAGCKTPSVGTG